MGPFSRDEDLMIGGRVMQWYDKGPGLWESLEEEMGREKGSIMARFDYLAVRKFALDWDKELVRLHLPILPTYPSLTDSLRTWTAVG